MKQENKKQDAGTGIKNFCKHCGEEYTVAERIRVYGNNPFMQGYCSAGCYTEGVLMSTPAAPVKEQDSMDMPKIGTPEFNELCEKHFSGHVSKQQDSMGYTQGVMECKYYSNDEKKVYSLGIVGDERAWIAELEADNDFIGVEEQGKNAQRIVYAWNNISKVEEEVKRLREALEYVKNIIENSDNWWMDCPNKGGFDTEIINSALNQK